jgi:chromosome segregation ATPase
MAKATKSFTLDPEIKEFADGLDNASAVVNDLLKSYKQSGGGRELAALELRLKHKQNELERTQEKEEALRNELQEIKILIDDVSAEKPTIEDAGTSLEGTPLTEDNPAVENWAQKLGMTTGELIEALETRNHH